jgi:DNA repair exonuclease SbcCD ATPase subunit
MARIKYNKERLSGKQVGGGGPRDRQLAQKIRNDQAILGLTSPSMSARVSTQPEIDLSQYLPLVEVKKKLEEAAATSAESERKRFESGLKNLNDQLNAERKKIGAFQDQLINANSEITRLKAQINQSPEISEKTRQLINEKNILITELKSNLDVKSQLYDKVVCDLSEVHQKLSDSVERDTKNQIKIAELEANLKIKEEIYLQSSCDLEELKDKLDKLYTSISDGSIKPLVGSKMERPALEDKIFIDPIEKNKELELDSYINIKEDEDLKDMPDRDVNTDLAKLRSLLKL